MPFPEFIFTPFCTAKPGWNSEKYSSSSGWTWHSLMTSLFTWNTVENSMIFSFCIGSRWGFFETGNDNDAEEDHAGTTNLSMTERYGTTKESDKSGDKRTYSMEKIRRTKTEEKHHGIKMW